MAFFVCGLAHKALGGERLTLTLRLSTKPKAKVGKGPICFKTPNRAVMLEWSATIPGLGALKLLTAVANIIYLVSLQGFWGIP